MKPYAMELLHTAIDISKTSPIIVEFAGKTIGEIYDLLEKVIDKKAGEK